MLTSKHGFDLRPAAVSAEVSCEEVEGRKEVESVIDICGEEEEGETEAVLGPRVIREDHHPGSVPGFEHSVNAEPGSMGAGAGAAAAIDHNEPSPRGAAIEKAQAELRWDLAVREERRRELEFLEKGGEPLDFKFGEVPSLTFSSPSPAEPLADQLLFSEGEGGSVANSVANGSACENIVIQGVSGGRDLELDEHSFRLNARDATDKIPSKGGSSQPNPSTQTQIELFTKRESGDFGGDRVGAKCQAYAKRNRQWSQRLGNGHLPLKEQEKVVDGKSSVVEADINEAPGATKDEATVEMGFQLLPDESPCAASGKWNGVTPKQELEPPMLEVMTRCGALLEQHAADVSTDVGKGRELAVLSSHMSLKSGDVGVNLCVNTREKDGSLALAGKGSSNVDLFFSEAQLSPNVQSFCELGSAGLQERVEDKSVLGRASANPDRARDEVTATGHIPGHGTARREARGSDGMPPLPPKSNSVDKVSSRAHKVVSEGGLNRPPRSTVYEQSLNSSKVTEANGNSIPVTRSILEDFEGGGSMQKSIMIKKAVARGGSNIRQVNRDQSVQDEKRLDASNARIKIEDVAAEARATPSATTEVDASSSQMSGGAPKPQELRTEGQAGAIVGGIPRSIGRTSSSSALLKNKFPGVVIPWEKEHDPIVEAEAAKHRADITAKARKAHEDFILEEAENLQAVRNSTVDQVLDSKPWPEGLRRKAHWDFVLEEMVWMANDFMQESLWKRAAAVQICRCVALQRREEDFLASELSTRQQKVAKVLANAVEYFWHSAKESFSKEKAVTSVLGKTQVSQVGSNNSNEDVDEAVPMDVDVPGVGEARGGIGSEKVNKKKSMAIQQYAMRFLRSSSLESMVQPKALARTKWHSECTSSSILEPFQEDQFPEESLFYVVPDGSMEVYRASVKSYWAMLEAKLARELASEIDADGQAVRAAAEDATVSCDFGYYGNDGGSQDNDLQLHFMLSPLGSGGGLPGIAKKKRKKIPKVNTAVPKVEAGGPLSGFVYEPSVSGGEQGLPSPAVTGKRSLPGHSGFSCLPGVIPTKRARSSAGNLRLRAPGVSTSPGAVGGHFPRSTVGSQLQQEELMNVPDGSNREDNSSDTPSDTLHAVVSDGTFVPSKSKKKKKLTHSVGGSLATRQGESRVSGNATNKGSDGDHDRQDFYEVIKRKGDQLLPPGIPASETGLGSGTDASELPAPPGSKKPKVSDANSEAMPGPIQPASQTGQQPVSSGVSKPIRHNSNRDRSNRKIKSSKGSPLNAPTGNGIPWSLVEDQAILVLVHDLGPNWELVSDVLSYNSQLKGIYRKPKLCRERHKLLSERLGTEIQENSDDVSPLQTSTAQPPGIPKGNNTRLLLQRIHGTVEEDTLKVHLEQIILTWEKFRPRKSTDAQEQKVLATPHPSHGIAISQFCTGGSPNPLDLCDRLTANGEVPPPSFTMQASPHGNGPGLLSGGLPPGSSVRPPSAGMPPGLPGSNGLPPGTPAVSSSATMNAAAARDAQRFTAMRLSPEETNRLRMATAGPLGAYNQRLPQQVTSPTTGLPVLSGLSNPNDLPLLPTSATGGLLSGLNRSMSLPRPGLSGLGSAAVSSMGSAGLGIMLPPGGVNLGSSGSLPSGSVSSQFMARKTRELLQRMTSCSEEQRMQLIQQLQHLALQGEPQAAAALASLNSDMAVVSSPPQSFSHQQQQQQQQQQHQAQQRQRNQQQQQLQLQNHQTQQQQQQAWQFQAARVNEQQQRQQQLQHQKRLLGGLPALGHPHPHTPNPPQQQMLAPHQPYGRSLSSQHMGPQPQHAISQQSHTLQKQLVQQQQQQVGVGPSSQVQQSSLPPSSLQSAQVSPTGSGPTSLTSQQQQQQPPLTQQNQVPGQMPQVAGPAKQVQSKQFQKHQQQNQQQQQASRVSKGLSRGPMMMQGLPQSNNLPSNLSIGSNSMLGELAGQPGAHSLQQGQRVLQPQVQIQSGKLQSWSQQSMSGKLPQMQSQGAQLQGGAQSQGLASVAVQQQGQQQQDVASQQQAQPATFPQQSPLPQQQLPSSTPIQQTQLQPPIPGQQQQSQQQHRPMQQQQEPPPQRLQTRHPGTAMGLPVPGQVGKTGMQLQGQGVSSQMASQPGAPTYQLGTPISMSGPSPHVTSLSSGLHSTTVGVNSSQWKSNQAASPMSGGMFNLTRTGSPGSAHNMSPMVAPSGLHIPSSNGNTGASIHGASMGGVPQAHTVMQGASGQKFAVSPGQVGREVAGSQQGVTAGEQSQQGSMPVSLATSNIAAAAQTRLPVQSSSSGMLPGSTMGLVTTSGPPNVVYQGVPVPGPGHSSTVPGSGLLYTMQPHQPHVGNVSMTGSAVSQRSASPASNGPAPIAMSAMGSTSLSVIPAGAVPSSSA